MPYGDGSEAEIEQRQQAALKHGVHAFERRGEAALQPEQRSRTVQLKELCETREGLVEIMKERCARAIMVAELCESWLTQQSQKGKTFEQMTMTDRISTYQETARRHIETLINLMGKSNVPSSPDVIIERLVRGNNETEDDPD